MTVWKFLKGLLGLGLFLYLKIPGLLLLLGGVILLCGILFLAKRFQQRMSILPVLIWTISMASILFVLAYKLPDIRIIDLLYF